MKNTSRRNFIKNTALISGGLALSGHGAVQAITNPAKINHPIHAFTKCLQFLDYNEMAETLARNGFFGADLTVREGGQVLPPNVQKDLPEAVKALRKAGVETNMIATNISGPDHPYTKPVLKTMAALGIRHYRLGYLSYDERKTMPENLDDYRRTFEKLEKLNRVYGVTGNYQNHSGSDVGSPVWDLYHLLKNCDPKYMGVQYDIRHATVEGGKSWPVGMKLLAPWIQTTVVKDFVWHKNEKGAWEIKNVPLGEGMVDFQNYFRRYKALNLKGPVSIHFEYDLGGAEHGKEVTTMPQEQIETYLKNDLTFLRERLGEFNLE